MLERLRDIAAERIDFAFETNLASRSWGAFIRDLRSNGYVVELFFFALPDAETALARVASRVLEGGHHVPEEVVRRRFENGRRLFLERYQDLVDRWHVLDAHALTPVVIAEGGKKGAPLVLNEAAWKDFTRP